jgi:multicomponent K+:H+ antiporter subunit E
MNRLIPSPALSIALFVLWVLLVQSSSAGNLVIGGALAVLGPVLTQHLGNPRARFRRPRVALTLLGTAIADMLRSNVHVASAILTRPSHRLRSRFVAVPLELRDPHGLAALAMIITFTPGTAWAQLSADERTLLIHALDVESDESGTVAYIKQRYERPLREIFE